MRNLLRVALPAILVAFAAAPLAAQAPQINPPTAEPPKPVEPPAKLPRPQAGEPKQNLDKLFEALKIAPTDESAKYVENRIWSLWFAAGGDTATLLMGRVKTAMDGKDYDLALCDCGSLIEICLGSGVGIGAEPQICADEQGGCQRFRFVGVGAKEIDCWSDLFDRFLDTILLE